VVRLLQQEEKQGVVGEGVEVMVEEVVQALNWIFGSLMTTITCK
jgi:hypothetical protein